MKVRAFFEVQSFDFQRQMEDHVKRAIESKPKDYILQVDESAFIDHIVSEYELVPISIDFDNEDVAKPVSKREIVHDHNPRYPDGYEAEVYRCTVSYPYSGSAVLFKVRPSSFSMVSEEIDLNERTKKLSINFRLLNKDPEAFKKLKGECLRRVLANMGGANKEAQNWNERVRGIAQAHFNRQKSQHKSENDFFEAINVRVDSDTESVFTPPTIKKKVIPAPHVDKKKQFTQQPTMTNEMYDDVLKIIYDVGKSMERKPSTYTGKSEEDLRDQFLLILETRYDSTTVTGETFNRGGKTDIILKYSDDGTNLFVAECKFWHGKSEYMKAISQLFDRYLTWRDSKVAIMLFVTNKDFSSVLETIKQETKSHNYYVSTVGDRGESSFSFRMHLNQDEKKPVELEVMAFHFDK